MGKNYRNRNIVVMQTRPLSRLHDDPSKRKESITSCNWSANTALKTKDKSGECSYYWPSSERLLESCSHSKKKTPEDYSKVLPCSIVCTDMDCCRMRNSSSITFLVSLSTNSWTNVFRPVSIKKVSRPRASTKPES